MLRGRERVTEREKESYQAVGENDVVESRERERE